MPNKLFYCLSDDLVVAAAAALSFDAVEVVVD